MYDIVNIPIFYEVPFKCQFKALTEKIDKNIIFYNKTEDKLYVTYWANTLTRKITGGCIKMSKYTKTGEKERVINYVLSHYSMQLLPCYYVELEKNKDEINIKTVEIKKEYGPTQILKSGYLFTSTPKPKKSKHIIKEEEIEEMGIEDDDLIEKEQDIEIDYEIPDIKQYIKDAGFDSQYLELFLPDIKQQVKSKILYPIQILEAEKIPSTISINKREELIKKIRA